VTAHESVPLNSSVLTIVLYVSGIGLLLWVASVSVIMGRKVQTARTQSNVPSGEGRAATTQHL
jgi:hypothetical protein